MRRLIIISLALFVVACFFRADCVHAEDLHYDVITFADGDELGKKMKWMMGYKETIQHRKYTVVQGRVIQDIPLIETHRQFVDLVIVKEPSVHSESCRPTCKHFINPTGYVFKGETPLFEVIKGEALITWREVTK